MNFRDLDGRPALAWQSPISRLRHAELIAAYNPERLLKELHDAGGTLEVMQNGGMKIVGGGNLPSAWHQAFTQHRHAVLEMAGLP